MLQEQADAFGEEQRRVEERAEADPRQRMLVERQDGASARPTYRLSGSM